jgi:hypothetical protein
MLSKLNPNAVLAAAVAVVVVVVGGLLGLYALAPAKPPVGPLFAAIPGGLAFLGVAFVGWVQRSHGSQLATIGKNTNGILTERINQAVATSVPIAVATALAGKVVAVIPSQPDPPALVPAETTGA